ncbi:TolC family protein [Neptunomonas japonica]|uniref:TolC family protein n=1 Tax=Neptunomonas japonica TaxID=417574 RepID=UPI0004161552|nr:TolC family protein [Neptunomonas japonica]
MLIKAISQTGLILLLTMLISACGSLPQPRAELTKQLSIPAEWDSNIHINASEGSTKLLDLFDEPELKKLINEVLNNNLDLQQTALRLKQQRLLTRQTKADSRPDLNLNITSQRNKEEQINTAHSLALSLNWELDVWGRLADANNAAQSTTAAQTLDYQAARNSLAGRAIQSWIDISLRQKIVNTEQQWLTSLQNNEAVILERYKRGLGDLNDLATSRAATARIKANLIARQTNQRDAKRALNLLRGEAANATLPTLLKVPHISTPPALLPAQVLANRADLQSAYLQIQAADNLSHVAYKQLLPNFSFRTSISDSSPHLEDLLKGSPAWSLLSQLTAPLFNAGRLKAGVKISQLDAELSFLNYQKTLLIALNEVESTLNQELSLADQEQALRKAQQNSEASLNHYQTRYRDGVSDILNLLSAQQSTYEAQIQVLQIRQARLSNRISLGLALGLNIKTSTRSSTAINEDVN